MKISLTDAGRQSARATANYLGIGRSSSSRFSKDFVSFLRAELFLWAEDAVDLDLSLENIINSLRIYSNINDRGIHTLDFSRKTTNELKIVFVKIANSELKINAILSVFYVCMFV